MKNKILFRSIIFSLSFITSLSANAQLEVETSGNVRLNNSLSIRTAAATNTLLNIDWISNNENMRYGIQSHLRTNYTMATGPIISIYGFADGTYTTVNCPINTVVGVFGRAYMTNTNASKFSAGVMGIANVHNGVGVYGGVDPSPYGTFNLPTVSNGTYAGYFAGNVKVTHTLTATTVTETSDLRLKDNICDLNQTAVNNIKMLRPVEYKFKSDTTQYPYHDNAYEMKVSHFGLIAQELQAIFPNLVYEDGNGYLSINYTELIPILIKSVQELSTEVEVLKAQVNKLQTNK